MRWGQGPRAGCAPALPLPRVLNCPPLLLTVVYGTFQGTVCSDHCKNDCVHPTGLSFHQEAPAAPWTRGAEAALSLLHSGHPPRGNRPPFLFLPRAWPRQARGGSAWRLSCGQSPRGVCPQSGLPRGAEHRRARGAASAFQRRAIAVIMLTAPPAFSRQ